MSKPLIIITNKMEPISMDADEFTKIIEKAYEYGVEDGVLKARTETVPIFRKQIFRQAFKQQIVLLRLIENLINANNLAQHNNG